MLSPEANNLFLTLIEIFIPLVIQGLESCFALRWDKTFIEACLLTILLSLL